MTENELKKKIKNFDAKNYNTNDIYKIILQ